MSKIATKEGTHNGHSVKHLTTRYLDSLRIMLLFIVVYQHTCPKNSSSLAGMLQPDCRRRSEDQRSWIRCMNTC